MFLAGNDPSNIIGNFIADHVKGDEVLAYSEGIRKGIGMHRSVDSYTDSHPVVRSSIMRLRYAYRKYAGVVVDMFYDHFLSSWWDHYCVISLDEFTESRFGILMTHYETFPERAKYLLHFMMKDNWIKGYGTLEGLNRALTGMSRRTNFVSGMDKAIGDLQVYYKEFGEEFCAFFPELVDFVANKFNISIDYRCDNFPVPSLVPELTKINALPGSQIQPAGSDGDR